MLSDNYKEMFGSCSEEEANLLYDYAMKAPINRFMEIGTFVGRSASILGQAAKERNGTLICIDLFRENQYYWKDPKVIVPKTRETFLANMDRSGLMNTFISLRGNSNDILPTLNGKFGLIYIDGGHEIRSVLVDALMAWQHLIDGSYLIFHDCANPTWKDVGIVVDCLIEKWKEELEYKKTSNDNMVVFRKCTTSASSGA